MRLLLLVAAVTLLSGCGRPPGTQIGFEIEVAAFQSEGRARGWNDLDVSTVNIRLVDSIQNHPNGGIAAICKGFNDYGDIEVIRGYWNVINKEYREILIFHELGHCVLGKGHVEEQEIMNSFGISDTQYKADRAHYLNVLFKR